MNSNPLFNREIKARWKARPAFWLMLVYAGVLALAMTWRYDMALSRNHEVNVGSGLPIDLNLAQVGHDLFVTLSSLQLVAWMLIAPALMAPAIAAERERGLLECLQLSSLSTRSILVAKLGAVLAFIGLMLLVPLPIAAVCFLLGGVSPGEVALSLLLNCMTACTGAVMGLFCSTRSHRTAGALRSAFVFVLVWGVGSALAFGMAEGGLPFQWRWIGFLFAWIPDGFLRLLGMANPVVAALSVLDFNTNNPTDAANYGVAYTFNLAFQAILCAFLLRRTARDLTRPLPPPRWIDRNQWKARLRALLLPEAATVERKSAPALSLSRDVREKLLWELPLASLIRFRNPVLQREVRSRFRLRSGSSFLSMLRLLLGLVVGGVYVLALFCALDPMTREGSWNLLTRGGTLALLLAVVVMGAGAFTREREFGACDGLRLSLLSSGEILWGKLMAPLATCFYLSIPFWPILLLCLLPASSGIQGHTIGLEEAIATLMIVGSTLFAVAACSLLFSWLCRRTATAVTWSLVAVSLLLFAVPWFISANDICYSNISLNLNNVDDSKWWSHPFLQFHPALALQNMQSGHSYPPPPFPPPILAFGSTLFMLLLSGILLMTLQRWMRAAIRKKDTRQSTLPKQTRGPYVITIR